MSILSTLSKYGNQLRTSIGILYRALPRSRQELVAIHREKIGLVKEAGAARVASEGVRTLITLTAESVSRLITMKEGPFPEARPWNDQDLYRSYPFFKYLPDTLAREIAKYIPPVTFPVILVDRKNGFASFQLPINDENIKTVEDARKLVAQTLGEYGYVGWSNDIDRSYDFHSQYFVAMDQKGKIIGTSRLVHKEKSAAIAFENGLRRDGTSYKLEEDEGGVIDINSFFNRKENREALYPLFGALGRYSWLIGGRRAFCLCDRNNKFIRKLYQKAGFRFSKRFDQAIYFPTFGMMKGKKFEPTFWSIMEMGQLRILAHYLRSLLFRAV